MRVRVALVVAYGALLGAWFYADQQHSQGVYELLHGGAVAIAFFLVLPVLAGWIVGRWWVLAVLIGPLSSLGYLQAIGYVSPWNDGVPPLGLPNVVALAWMGAGLIGGLGVRQLSRSRSLTRNAS